MTAALVVVGGGTGDPDHLVLRGGRRIADAEAVLWTDAAVEPLLELAGPSAAVERVAPEQLITAVERHLAVGRATCVLVPGDPWALRAGAGREVEELRAAGLDPEVVPGVALAVAGPHLDGRPLTLRTSAVLVAVVREGTAAGDLAALRRLGGTVAVVGRSRVDAAGPHLEAARG